MIRTRKHGAVFTKVESVSGSLSPVDTNIKWNKNITQIDLIRNFLIRNFYCKYKSITGHESTKFGPKAQLYISPIL